MAKSAPRLKKALDYLYGLNPGAIKLGLENTRRLLNHFGDPHLKIRTVHIAGTNGKGSTAAFVESILRSSGQKVGLYTSPHLLYFQERIQIDRRFISEPDLCKLIFRVKKAVEVLKLPITFFEFATVMAFLYFFENKVDWNVIEVGMGGRLDATRLCQAEISIITSIGLDHTQYLGTTLKQIAYEKACIINNFGTVIAHVESEEAFDVLKNVAQERSAQIKRCGEDFKTALRAVLPQGQTIDFTMGDFHLEEVEVPLIGRHQASNAGLALAACLELRSKGVPMDTPTLRDGLKSTQWKGRMEVVSQNPAIVMDCAHNPDGVRKLTETLREYFSFQRCFLVLGFMKDKPVDEMLKIFLDFADHIFLARPKQERAMDPQQLKDRLQDIQKPIELVSNIPYALRIAKNSAGPNDLICITGSIFTVSEAKEFLINEAVA
ncbi:MAG: bifunctional folylpolyglutamate synthase/dihydrofolate synthase [Nitrospinaceae bacterium]|nr:MAG: bifunctional folylpolyglutamate synthase/dihydrofolate synthase [Nitrospinaceae bacterium]